MRLRHTVLIAAMAGTALLATAIPAHAAPAVTNTNDSGAGSLRQAIAEAGRGRRSTSLPAPTR